MGNRKRVFNLPVESSQRISAFDIHCQFQLRFGLLCIWLLVIASRAGAGYTFKISLIKPLMSDRFQNLPQRKTRTAWHLYITRQHVPAACQDGKAVETEDTRPHRPGAGDRLQQRRGSEEQISPPGMIDH